MFCFDYTGTLCEPQASDRFYRPDASRTAATGGFGIGLSIAKSIAEAHHGTIRASVQESRITFAAELK